MTFAGSDHVHVTQAMVVTALALAACVSLPGPAKAQVAPAGDQTAAGSTVQPAQAKPRPAPGSPVNAVAKRNDQPTAIRIIPPGRRNRERLSGRVEIQTLIIDPLVKEVEFFLDGRRTSRITRKPYTTDVELADPPREQTLEVRGYDARNKYLGSDRIILNRLDAAFAVRIVEVRRVQEGGYAAFRVEAAVSAPRSASLVQVEFYRGQHLIEVLRDFGGGTVPGAPRTITVETLMESVAADDFVRVVAILADGREREDAELLQGADYRSEIDVQMVQLQVLVTDREGNPASSLTPDDFEVRDNGARRPVEDLHRASDIPLVLGLAIDSSSSVLPIRERLIDVSAGFLKAALSSDDRAFLVHFNDTVRVLQPLSSSKGLLVRHLHYLSPRGGTALNDAILFSLLQFRNEPGRRALIVVTDGVDEHSRSEPKQSADFAERLGLPIYFIELDHVNRRVVIPGQDRRTSFITSLITAPPRVQRNARKRLRRISRQTGGRLFTIGLFAGTSPLAEQLKQVFDQIQEDLRHQHVLTYYSDQPPGAAIEPEVRLTRRGLTLRSAVPLE